MYAENDEEFLEKTTEYLERFNKTKHVDNLSLASAIEDVLNPNNSAITFENFLESEAYNATEKSKLRQLFKPYLQEGSYGN